MGHAFIVEDITKVKNRVKNYVKTLNNKEKLIIKNKYYLINKFEYILFYLFIGLLQD
jgi:GTPase involved in cell partitioning and DNA repair